MSRYGLWAVEYELPFFVCYQALTLYSPSRACRLALAWVRRSPGSVCGKNTAGGSPFLAASNLNPTACRRSFQPGIPPTLFSMDWQVVYMEFFIPWWILWRDFSIWKIINSLLYHLFLIIQNNTVSKYFLKMMKKNWSILWFSYQMQ